MDSISFRNLKFFKVPLLKKKPQKQEQKPSAKEQRFPFWRKLTDNPFLFLILFVIIISYLASYLPSKSLPHLNEGEIANSDIIAPDDLTIIDKETTEKRQHEAAEGVPPVYNFDRNASLNLEENINEFFTFGKEFIKNKTSFKLIQELEAEILDRFGLEVSENDLRYLIKEKFSPHLEESLIALLTSICSQPIISSRNIFIHGENEKGLLLLSGQEERNIKATEVLDLREAKEKLREEIKKLDIPKMERDFLVSFSPNFILPNMTYNRMETEVRKQREIAKVEPVFYNIKKGKVIIRKGDEVTKETVKQIELINQNLRSKPNWLINFGGTLLLFSLIFLTLWYYLKSLLKSKEALKNFVMMGLTLVLSLLFYKISVVLAQTFSERSSFSWLKSAESYRFAFPLQFGAFIFVFLTSTHIALIFTIVNSILFGYLFQGNFFLMLFGFLGGLAAIYGIKYYGRQKNTSIFKAGLYVVAPANILIILTFHLIREKLTPPDIFASDLLMGIIGGVLSASLSYLFIPLLERIFGFLTPTRLLELSNSESPLFKEMAIEAPGSYHHSLIVATLAEKAAEAIKLDSALVKASALYHDIGKLRRPEYFIENIARNPDMHKDLKPSMSKLVIINHVKEGVEIAKKIRLPKKIRDIIEQHHGTSLVRYFFEKAKEAYDPEMHKIGEESFRYPGPIPKSKEAGLVMLADSIEAASRSLSHPSEANLKRLITEIINNYLQDGQLDDSDFTLKELRAIASSFLSSLNMIHKKRTEYPGFDFEMKKKKKGKTRKKYDRNNKQTEEILDKSKEI